MLKHKKYDVKVRLKRFHLNGDRKGSPPQIHSERENVNKLRDNWRGQQTAVTKQ